MKNIRTLTLIMMVAYILCSCSKKRHSTSTYNKRYEAFYAESFKNAYMSSCLEIGFNNMQEIKKLLFLDKSFHIGEPILEENDVKIIDSLVMERQLKIKQDSINSIGRVAEGAEGKKVLKPCFCDYKSQWLDKLAKKKAKAHTIRMNRFWENYGDNL